MNLKPFEKERTTSIGSSTRTFVPLDIATPLSAAAQYHLFVGPHELDGARQGVHDEKGSRGEKNQQIQSDQKEESLDS